MKQRKKWTPQENLTGADRKARERKKWQLAFRRYVVEQKATPDYAPYFGLPIHDVRKWIKIQFTGDLKWENFGTAWQFEHLLPLSFFDFNLKEDLQLCWNFTNISVARLGDDVKKTDLLSLKGHFDRLFEKSGYPICKRMADRIRLLEGAQLPFVSLVEEFLIEKKYELEKMESFSAEEFNRLNQGISLRDLLLEKEILSKFG